VVEVLHLPHPQLGGLGLANGREHTAQGTAESDESSQIPHTIDRTNNNRQRRCHASVQGCSRCLPKRPSDHDRGAPSNDRSPQIDQVRIVPVLQARSPGVRGSRVRRRTRTGKAQASAASVYGTRCSEERGQGRGTSWAAGPVFGLRDFFARAGNFR
jgi:hypothetical protein